MKFRKYRKLEDRAKKKDLGSIPNHGKHRHPSRIDKALQKAITRLQGPGERDELLKDYTKEEAHEILRGLRMRYMKAATIARAATIKKATTPSEDN